MLTVTNGGNHDWANMPLHEMAVGNAMDCDFTLRSWRILRGEMKSKSLNHVYDNLLTDVAVLLSKVEFRGIDVNNKYLTEVEVDMQKAVAEQEKILSDLSNVKGINPNSTEQLAAVLFGAKGYNLKPTEFSAKTKKPCITESHLTSHLENSTTSDEARDFIVKLLKYKSLGKLYRTYVKGIEKAIEYNGDNRIYSSYNFGTTVTGRLSCSNYNAGAGQNKGVSFHTLPRETDESSNIRKLMKADDGKVFLAADFSQAELRVLAQCCKDKNLIEAFKSGQDLHSFTASLVFEKPADQVTKQERQIAKSVSFLIVYGGGPMKLSQQIGRSVGYCKSIFKAYQDAFPNVFKWINFVHKYVRENGYAVSLFGRRRHLPNVNSPIRKYQYRALRQGMNFVIQSSASDIMLHALKRLDEQIKGAGINANILATVHDSVELQCEKSDVEAVVKIMQDALPSTEDLKTLYNLDFVVPFEVDIEIGKSFGEVMTADFDTAGSLSNLDEILTYVESA
jgi:DNA polymerase-1